MQDMTVQARKILYRCHHRGTKELDLMLGQFAQAHVPTMAPDTLTAFADFIELPEPVILEILIGKLPLPADLPADLTQMLNAFAYSPGSR